LCGDIKGCVLNVIAEHTYDNRRICNGCSYLAMNEDGWTGLCECKENRVKDKHRCVTDRKCTYKRMIIGFKG